MPNFAEFTVEESFADLTIKDSSKKVSKDEVSGDAIAEQGSRNASSSSACPHHPSEANDKRMHSLQSFLQSGKEKLLAKLSGLSSAGDENIVIIMGNDAADLDSVASAIALAYLLTALPHPRLGHANGRTTLYVPIIQANRSTSPLRPENNLVLQITLGDSASMLRDGWLPNLTWLDDIADALSESTAHESIAMSSANTSAPALRRRNKFHQDVLATSPKLGPANGISFGLVDHNRLGPLWGSKGMEREVRLIVDHHADEQAHLTVPLRWIKPPDADPVGSCASMVAMLFQGQWLSKEKHTSGGIPITVADLLLTAIALDTDNLKLRPLGKGTKHDAKAYNLLLPFSSLADPTNRARIISNISSMMPQLVPNHLITSALFGSVPEKDVAFANQLTSPPSPVLVKRTNTEPDPDTPTQERIDALRDMVAPAWKSISFAKRSVIYHLSADDFLRRDCKIMSVTAGAVAIGSKMQLDLHIAFSTIPTSMSALVYGFEKTPIKKPEEERQTLWDAWWRALDDFMAESDLDFAICLMRCREKQRTQDEKDKHMRELIIIHRQSTPQGQLAPPPVFSGLLKGLEQETYISDGAAYKEAPASPLRLMLKQPWKGKEIPSSGKRDRLDRVGLEGNWLGSPSGNTLWVRAYRQRNAKANRKVILPVVLSVLKHFNFP
ncbi:DHH phosphoesterase [Tilletiaria anomala UBC 951]|uniref:DHH phosphoesterase n=1 Tax=Tilletiaria anomala (strain ATCC 24038 / CBS 436.72 / UBC 951) TaxID=1037660 RepID=A0A066WLI7_TILAU|nr:DHH phosphoesterase [Tilletiaria anomala UBC 951]KDN53458.1 DHH phosphoesterase [Tilletiaria anomala UBC 951]